MTELDWTVRRPRFSMPLVETGFFLLLILLLTKVS